MAGTVTTPCGFKHPAFTWDLAFIWDQEFISTCTVVTDIHHKHYKQIYAQWIIPVLLLPWHQPSSYWSASAATTSDNDQLALLYHSNVQLFRKKTMKNQEMSATKQNGLCSHKNSRSGRILKNTLVCSLYIRHISRKLKLEVWEIIQRLTFPLTFPSRPSP